MESICGLEERRGWDHAVDAGNSGAVRSAQPVSGAREHSRWSRISGLAQAEVQRGPSVDYRGLLRRRVRNLFAGTGLFLPRCSGVRQTGRATVSRATSGEGTESISAAEGKVEVTDEKRFIFQLALAGGTDRDGWSTTNDHRSAGPHQAHGGQQNHFD